MFQFIQNLNEVEIAVIAGGRVGGIFGLRRSADWRNPYQPYTIDADTSDADASLGRVPYTRDPADAGGFWDFLEQVIGDVPNDPTY
jgi:hypothetical protein